METGGSYTYIYSYLLALMHGSHVHAYLYIAIYIKVPNRLRDHAHACAVMYNNLPT